MAEPKFRDAKQEFIKRLIDAREEADMDLARVAERSKINIDYLRKIEAGDWDFLPASYVRVFLRTYAQIIGLDVGEVVETFDKLAGRKKPGVPRGATEDAEEEQYTPGKREPRFTLAEEGRSRSSTLNSPIIKYVIPAIVAIIILIILLFVILPGGEGDRTPEEIAFEDVVQENTYQIDQEEADSIENSAAQFNTEVEMAGSETTDTAVPTEDQQSESTIETLTLQAVADQASYLLVIPDHDTTQSTDLILSSGSTRTFSADSVFRIVIGNTPGLRLSLNGRQLTGFRETGRVVTATVGADGVRELLAGNRELNR